MSRVVQPDGWPRPRGYANGMAATGELLAIAGQIGWDATETLVAPAFVPQLRQALANVCAVVEAAGGSVQHLVSLTIYVTDKHEYAREIAAVGATYRELMGKHFPTMALVQVADLLLPGAKVEIQGLAVIPPAPSEDIP